MSISENRASFKKEFIQTKTREDELVKDKFSLESGYRDELKEYYSLRRGVGFRISEAYFLKITGKDARQLLQRMTTSNVSQLKPGFFQRTMFLDAEANFIDRLFLLDFGDSFWAVGNEIFKNKIPKWIINYRLKEDVSLLLQEDFILFEMYGSQADSFISMLVDSDLSLNHPGQFFKAGVEPNSYYYFFEKDFAGKNIYYFITQKENSQNFIDYIRDNSSVFELNFAGKSAFEKFRIEYGYTAAGKEITDFFTPFDFNLQKEINLTKGRFIGYEGVHKLIENKHLKKKFVGLLPDKKIKILPPIQLKGENDEIIGYITSITDSVLLKRQFCLATVSEKAVTKGKLSGLKIDGEILNFKIQSLPLTR